jgi:hypothetical protein
MLYSFFESLQEKERSAEVHLVAGEKSTWLECNWFKNHREQDRTVNLKNTLKQTAA